MSEGSRGGRSYWPKYRSIKRSVRRQVEDLQEDSDKLTQEKNFPENTGKLKIHLYGENLHVTI